MKKILIILIGLAATIPFQVDAQAVYLYKKRKFLHPSYSTHNYKQPDKALAAQERHNADKIHPHYRIKKITHPLEADHHYKTQRLISQPHVRRLAVPRRMVQRTPNPMMADLNYKRQSVL